MNSSYLAILESQNTYQKFVRIEPWLHIFLWAMVFLYPYLKYSEREGGYMMSFAHELNSLVFKMIISYVLFFWVFPKVNEKKYVFLATLAIVLNTIFYEFADRFFHPGDTHFWQHFFTNLLTFLSFAVVFFTLFAIKKSYRQQLQLDILLKDKRQAEMNALKAQINPHFLFNTLNTIYANALKKDEGTPELILKLSNGFRYLFHEGQEEYVSLKREVQHLQDYISLQEERLAKKVKVNFSVELNDSKQQIAPLLLIPFVENAFKYTSLLKGEGHSIQISIKVSDANFSFQCVNPFHVFAQEEVDAGWAASGIGINNVKRRLALVYPERHTLAIQKKDHLYCVNLSLHL